MRKFVAALVALAFVAACAQGGTKDSPSVRGETLRPKFAPEPSTSTSTTVANGSTPKSPVGSGSSTTTTSTSVVTEQRLEASITDPAGDLTPSVEHPPSWADLVGAHLTRTASGFELRVRVAGGSAPERTPDSDHTMNIASFYDVDGDGEINYEVWANVADSGWGSSYFDDVQGHGKFQQKSGVTVRPDGDEVVILFPLSHLADSSRFRWSVSSEWGRYETIGTITAARDYMPGDGAVAFPA